jgi:hypothetical protein
MSEEKKPSVPKGIWKAHQERNKRYEKYSDEKKAQMALEDEMARKHNEALRK